MVEKKKMSVAEILAAARKMDSKGGAPSTPEQAAPPATPEPAESEPVAESTPAPAAAADEVAATESAEAAAPAASAADQEGGAAKPAKPAKPAAGGARPSVAEILAMARANKPAAAKPAEAAPAAAKPAAPKPATKPAAAKAAAAKPAAEKPAAAPAAEKAPAARGVRDTSSILAAARAQGKAGPISKSEAAAKSKPTAPPAPKPAEKAPRVAPPMPTKPPAARPPAAKKGEETEGRRFFLGVMLGSFLGVGFTSLGAAFGLWGLALARFMFPNTLMEPPSQFKVGPPSDFPPGTVSEKFKAQFGVWIVNTEYQGVPQIVALKTVCTHLGCTPNWLEGEQKFKCPCHGSGFYKDGINFEGPAPRPLERYGIRLADDGQLEVDKSKLFQEEMGQWADPGSYVTV